jgi:hypothetical protein
MVWRAFTTAQQVADGSHVNLIRLFAPHEVLLTILLDRKTIDEFDRLSLLEQMPCQIFEIVAGGFHAD